MLQEMLKERNLPPFLSKAEMLAVLQREEYGYLPPKPTQVTFTEYDSFIPRFCAGKAVSKKVEITATVMEKDFTFPCYVNIPNKEGKHPFFICINFRDALPDMYVPVEEIIDAGYAVLVFSYLDITSDDMDFTNGLAGVLYEDGKRKPTDAGKIALWAWAAHRVMDYAQTLDNLDLSCSIVCGHSRLGKTALFTAATDDRFMFAHSNDSGCSGAALARGTGKNAEKVHDICKNFPQWFCENYYRYAHNEEQMPFDQHFLPACIAPRYVYIASASEDDWASPESEMLTCAAISEIYESFGKKGFISEDRLPEIGDVFHEGSVGYHLRKGLHYFSREDWNLLIAFINSHRG